MTKITKKDYFKILAEVVENSNVENKQELKDFITKEITLLETKALKNATRETEKDKENKIFIEEIYNILKTSDKSLTITEIQACGSEQLAGLQNQRVSALVKKLKDCGKVTRTELKKKAYFKIAE